MLILIWAFIILNGTIIMGDIEVFNKLQLDLLLESAKSASVSPNNEFCIDWINSNSENLRNCWNAINCKSCKFNTHCPYIYELLKRVVDEKKYINDNKDL